MLDQVISEVYTKFRLQFNQSIFRRFQEREASLTTVETFCVEIIDALGTPTINEFASFTNISAPNAAYKVNNLIRKGYIRKIQSETDKREYHLQVTQKYYDYYNISQKYLHIVTQRVEKRFTKEEILQLESMLRIVSDELMPEMPRIRRHSSQQVAPEEDKAGQRS